MAIGGRISPHARAPKSFSSMFAQMTCSEVMNAKDLSPPLQNIFVWPANPWMVTLSTARIRAQFSWPEKVPVPSRIVSPGAMEEIAIRIPESGNAGMIEDSQTLTHIHINPQIQ